MDALNCVVRVCRDRDDEIVWTALYLDGVRFISMNYFDVDKMVDKYSDNGQYIEDVFIEEYPEDVYENIDEYFPEYEDFTYLLDMGEIGVGEPVYLFDGVYIVSKVWEGYREKGNYKIVHWVETNGQLSCTEVDNEWEGHNVTMFSVEGSEEEFVWEDYNYQQSFLYLYLKVNGKLV
jgi:hypothetical protein